MNTYGFRDFSSSLKLTGTIVQRVITNKFGVQPDKEGER
jgi:hypothetical protein